MTKKTRLQEIDARLAELDRAPHTAAVQREHDLPERAALIQERQKLLDKKGS